MPEKITTIDEYIMGFEPDVQKTLNELRRFVKTHAPESIEKISYGMPAFFLNGNLLYFAVFKGHYSVFPGPSGIDEFEVELAPYRSGKGTLRFKFNEAIPWDILKKVIKYRIEANLKKVKNKKMKFQAEN
jgi:uncharacterized protein YdhG (YjbR/CyaY superfamily)